MKALMCTWITFAICSFSQPSMAQTYQAKYKGQLSDSSAVKSGYHIYFSYDIIANSNYAYIKTKQDSTNLPLINAHTDDEEFFIDFKKKIIYNLSAKQAFPIIQQVAVEKKIPGGKTSFFIKNKNSFFGISKTNIPSFLQPGTLITGLKGGISEINGPNQTRKLIKFSKTDFNFSPIIKSVKDFPVSKMPLELL